MDKFSTRLLAYFLIPTCLGFLPVFFLLYYSAPLVMNGVKTVGTISPGGGECSRWVTFYTTSGEAIRRCFDESGEELNTQSTTTPVWYLEGEPRSWRVTYTDPRYLAYGGIGLAFFLILSTFLNILWHAWRLHRWAGSEDVDLLLVDWVPAWSNPFGAGSALSNRMITFKVLVRDSTHRQCEAWIKYGKFWWWSLNCEVLWKDKTPGEKSLSEKLEERGNTRPAFSKFTDELVFK